MKKHASGLTFRLPLVLLFCAMLFVYAGQAATDFTRVPAKKAYMQAEKLAERYGIELTADGLPLYTPKCPQPLNAYLVTHPACEVGINRDGMYKVSEKGLVSSITKYLKEWMGEIEKQSEGAIRFVENPDDADILVVAKQSYFFHGNYRGGRRTVKGYGCRVQLQAQRLTVPGQNTVLDKKKTPGRTERTSGGSMFWKSPPELKGTKQLQQFVQTMLGWYGYGAAQGNGDVKAVQQALISRGLLESKASGTFDAQTKDAVVRLQEMKGLDATGNVDEKTLIALYYDEIVKK